MKEFVTMESLWEQVRAACPSPSWTVVAVERHGDPLNPDSKTPIWWVYAEPGVADEPDSEKRLAQRCNARHTNRERAFRLVAQMLRERYIVERLMRP